MVEVQNLCTYVQLQVTQVEVKVLTKIVLEVQVKSKQSYLKYTQKYFYQPKMITLARLQYITISQAFLLIGEEFLLTELLRGYYKQSQQQITLKNKSQNMSTFATHATQ